MLYDDGLIACDDAHLVIRRYYLWGGSKRIPYSSIRSVTERGLTFWTGAWRIWGSGDLVHYWNLDWRRPHKSVALEIHTGARILPTITPDDPEAVARILADHRPI